MPPTGARVRVGERLSCNVARYSTRASRTRFLGVTFALVVGGVTAHEHVGSDVAIERLLVPGPPAHPWTLVAGKYWQIASPESEDPAATDEAEGNRGACAQGMIEVQGSMKIDSDRGTVEGLQDTTCSDWISREFPERCATFDAERWKALSRELPARALRFCVDRFEYPNRKGGYPLIAVTWREAGALCQERGARLCTEDEWTFACEGEDARPYPTGYVRNPGDPSDRKGCVIDRPWRLFDERLLAVRDSAAAEGEIDFAWQGEASGSRPLCRSPFGVYDTTGNVDEWTRSVQRDGYASVFKGGYWGPVRARCRAATRAHDEDFYFYQQGFRCCADARARRGAQRRMSGLGLEADESGANFAGGVEEAAFEEEVALGLALRDVHLHAHRGGRGAFQGAFDAGAGRRGHGRSQDDRVDGERLDARLSALRPAHVRRGHRRDPSRTATRASRSASFFAMSARLS